MAAKVQTTITVPLNARDVLKRYKFRVSGETQTEISMGQLIPILVQVAEMNHAAVIEIVKGNTEAI